jgi:C1A family cysteine protease
MMRGRNVIRLALVLAILSTLAASALIAQAVRVAPVNPDFIAYRDAVAAGRWPTTTESGYPLGAIPTPFEMPGLRVRARIDHARAFPATYDLRSIPGKVPGIRDQGACGSCWSFASAASLETCMRPADALNVSEQNIRNLVGFDYEHCSGGTHLMTAAYLARWDGPVAEGDDPYNTGVSTSPTGLPVRKHLQEMLLLPDRTGPLDNDAIKDAVTTYGAVYVTFMVSDAYFDPSYEYHYNPGTSGGGHAVAIIGWDDDCDASNFREIPPGNGAFLIRNSWGSFNGLGGYFWMSYYDNSIGDLACFNVSEDTTNYQTIYQYDPLGYVNSMGVNQETLWTANIFPKSGGGQQIEAVGFYTTAANADYEVYIYQDPLPGCPRTGTLEAMASGNFTYAGFHTVTLPSPAKLAASATSFSVVVKVTTPGFNEPQAIEFAVAGYSSTATSALGQSHYSADGVLWDDLTRRIFTANCCIKAYGNPAVADLNWAGLTGWETDGVSPNAGNVDSTSFVFKVKYRDVSEVAPLKARCIIQDKVTGGWHPYANLGMTIESGTVGTGAVYRCSTTLPNGVYKYRFHFQAADGSLLTLDAPAHYHAGPGTYGPPVLAWTGKSGFAADGINPDSGPVGTLFQFQVLYTDSLGNAPLTHDVVVRRNGKLYRQKAMREFACGSYRTGKVFAITIPLNHAGTYEYSFLFEDSTGAAVSGDPALWQPAPTILGVTSAMVTSLTAMPSRTGAQMTFNLAAASDVTATVLNAAGRPVRTIVAAQPLEAGLQTLLWDRKADSGLPVPAGLYLIRVTARDAEGGQSTSMASLALP